MIKQAALAHAAGGDVELSPGHHTTVHCTALPANDQSLHSFAWGLFPESGKPGVPGNDTTQKQQQPMISTWQELVCKDPSPPPSVGGPLGVGSTVV